MTTKVTILGCGTSGGVPRPGGPGGAGAWGACDPRNPKNIRRRCSILVEEAGKTILVDTSPDLQRQLIDARVTRLDAVLWTHDHADHTHGIDDVRPLAIHQGPIDAWASKRTLASLYTRFGYVFAQPDVSVYSTLYRAHEIGDGPFTVAGVRVVPFEMDHGSTIALGFRFGGIAYCNDVVRLDERAFKALEGVDTLIVDAMRYRPHPTHAHLDLSLEWIARIKPRRAVLTNMHVDMDYDEVNRVTPAHVEPAYDGLVLEA